MIKKVTILDIAAELSMSRNTVAKALNNSDAVTYDTRMTVIKKAWEMGYQKMDPSILEEYRLVESLTKDKNVLILARRELSVFWNTIIVGISDELNRNNCHMRLNFISEEDEKNLVLPRDFEAGADAVIMMSIFEPEYTELILGKKLPTVCLDRPIGKYCTSNSCDSVLCEGRTSIELITESLIQQGMTKIGFIGDVTYCESINQRYAGFCSALAVRGMKPCDEIVFNSSRPEKYSNSEVEEIVNNLPYLPEAIVCANDDIALKCIRALLKKGIKCPDDIAITGFDNEEILTQAEPKLTTVSVRNRILGMRLVRQLIWRMENPEYPVETVLIETKPIYRKSSMAVKKRRDENVQ